ncbi:glutaredoxin family protein [Shimazuella sp. AN120528]|uniref:glutaredoxin family protein n=1 Tax=Shimazuella soli TaxID=1892854 RepID=UPI001F111619|nr:glutaredoxin family protein [Shimazuella soli]MCH5586094.1 glutaredoxin family protein [Shimazuella soli]
MSQSHVVIYTIPTCPDCHEAKRYFREKGVSFQEKDCTTDPDYPPEVYNLTGKQIVPTLVIDEHVFVGFSNNYDAIDKIIKEDG